MAVTKENIGNIVNNPNLTHIEKVKELMRLLDLIKSTGGGGGGKTPVNIDVEELLDDDDTGMDELRDDEDEGDGGDGGDPSFDDTSDFDKGFMYGCLFAQNMFDSGGLIPPISLSVELPQLPKMKLK